MGEVVVLVHILFAKDFFCSCTSAGDSKGCSLTRTLSLVRSTASSAVAIFAGSVCTPLVIQKENQILSYLSQVFILLHVCRTLTGGGLALLHSPVSLL